MATRPTSSVMSSAPDIVRRSLRGEAARGDEGDFPLLGGRGDGILSLASSSSSSSETPYTCWEALEAQRSLDEWTSSSLS